MSTLALIATGPGSSPSVAQASADVERAWQRVCEARDAFIDSPLGDTDELFARQAAWTDAIVEHERAKVRHAETVRRSQGRCGLRLVMGGRS